jgi:hypothetical protein
MVVQEEESRMNVQGPPTESHDQSTCNHRKHYQRGEQAEALIYHVFKVEGGDGDGLQILWLTRIRHGNVIAGKSGIPLDY